MGNNIKTSPYRVQVLDRALGILELLCSDGPELTLIEFSERLRLHKSTVHRLLGVLEQHRFVEKSSSNGKYRLGLKLFELGSKAIAHCGAAGKALLAFLAEDEVEDLIKRRGLKAFTRNTLTTPTQLRNGLQLVRERGYAIDNEEFEEGLECIGAPVRDYSGKVVAAMSIAGPASRITEDKVPVLARSVIDAAQELSAELGYQDPQREHRIYRSSQGNSLAFCRK